MATKAEELSNPNSCLSKAADDEPIFVLRAKDPLAADLVREWAMLAARHGEHEDAKCVEALAHARHMEQWRHERRRPHDPGPVPKEV